MTRSNADAIEKIAQRADLLPGFLMLRLRRAITNQLELGSHIPLESETTGYLDAVLGRYSIWSSTAANYLDEVINELVVGDDENVLLKLQAVAASLRVFSAMQTIALRGPIGIADILEVEDYSPKEHRLLKDLPDFRRLSLPSELHPTSLEFIKLPAGPVVAIPKCKLRLKRWLGDKPATGRRTLDIKPLVDVKGSALFAELAILSFLVSEGWRGVWIDSFHRVNRAAMRAESWNEKLPNSVEEVLALLQMRTKRKGGCWDVVAWRDDAILFCDAKLRGKDQIRPSQKAWLEAAMAEGFTPETFMIVEWDFA